jgi:hypothetical protein
MVVTVLNFMGLDYLWSVRVSSAKITQGSLNFFHLLYLALIRSVPYSPRQM